VPHFTSKNASTFLGFVGALSEQYCVVNRLQHNVTTVQARRIHRSGKAYATYIDAGLMADGEVESYLPTGFRLDVTNTTGEANYIFGLALKGPRIRVSLITEPAANGNQSYNQGFKPEALLLSSDLHSAPNAFVDHARLVIGAGTSPIARGTIFTGYRHNVSPTLNRHILSRGKIFRGFTEGAPSTLGREADLVSFTSTGYDLSWSGTPGGAQLLSVVIGSSTAAGATFEMSVDLDTSIDFSITADVLLEMFDAFDLDFIGSLVLTQASHHAITQFFGLKVNLDVKREVDSGEISALSSDATGTLVLFNKSFKSVDSITLTVEGTTPAVPIYNFDGSIPNPVSFKILVFNQAGARINATVSWKARGIV
jgi:hypothetical protein